VKGKKTELAICYLPCIVHTYNTKTTDQVVLAYCRPHRNTVHDIPCHPDVSWSIVTQLDTKKMQVKLYSTFQTWYYHDGSTH